MYYIYILCRLKRFFSVLKLENSKFIDIHAIQQSSRWPEYTSQIVKQQKNCVVQSTND